MDHRVLTIRRWLLLTLAVVACLCEPGLWFCLFAAPIIWTRTSGGTTGILIHPTGPPWTIATGDSADATCSCCMGDCAQCTTQHSGSVQVVLSGIANGVCGNCSALNGTFELAKISACTWSLTASVVLTDISGCHASLTSGTGANTVLFRLTDPTFVDCSYQRIENGREGARFNESYLTFSQNCAAWSSEGINPSTSDTGCNESGATCQVTSL